MKKKIARLSEHHCTILEQRHLVSEMTQCDTLGKSHENRYKCYLKATKKSRNNKACMYS